MDLNDPPKSPEGFLFRSSIGLLSMIPGSLSICAIALTFLALTRGWSNTSDRPVDFILIITSPFLALFLSGAGAGMGFGGLFQKGSNRLFAIIGLLLGSLGCSGCCFLAWFFFIMSGGGMGFSG